MEAQVTPVINDARSVSATPTLPPSQRFFQFKDVEQKAHDLFETSTQTRATLRHARTLRHQKSQLLSSLEKNWIDETLISTEKALRGVAALVEPARVDLQTQGSLSLTTRCRFVLRDGPRSATSLRRLAIATQGLNSVISVLCSRDNSAANTPTPTCIQQPNFNASRTKVIPATYDESEFLNYKRQRSSSTQASSATTQFHPLEAAELPSNEDVRRLTCSTTPVKIRPPVLFPGRDADGLQVCETQQLVPNHTDADRLSPSNSLMLRPYNSYMSKASSISLPETLCIPHAKVGEASKAGIGDLAIGLNRQSRGRMWLVGYDDE